MKFNVHEKAVLSVLSKLIHSVTNEEIGSRGGRKKSASRKGVRATRKVAAKTTGKRLRRTAEDAEKLRRQVLSARKKKVPVAEIAKTNNITTAYIYQLLARE